MDPSMSFGLSRRNRVSSPPEELGKGKAVNAVGLGEFSFAPMTELPP